MLPKHLGLGILSEYILEHQNTVESTTTKFRSEHGVVKLLKQVYKKFRKFIEIKTLSSLFPVWECLSAILAVKPYFY